MTEIFLQIIFGWPAIIASILLSIAGVWLKKPGLLVAAGFVGIPFALYMSLGYHTPAWILPLFQFGSAFAITRQKMFYAWLFITPMIFSAALLAYVVLTQPLGR